MLCLKPEVRFYCGIDLHTTSLYLCVLDAEGEVHEHRRIGNRSTGKLLSLLAPYLASLVVAVESTFPWYWLSDLCSERNIVLLLGHSLYLRHIHGAKTKNDRLDSRRIADLVRLGVFPVAYVYPKERRALRDLVRRRLYMVRSRARLITQVQIHNYQANNGSLGNLAKSRAARLAAPQAFSDPDVRAAVEANMAMVEKYDEVVRDMEKHIMERARQTCRRELAVLQSVPGIGQTLALTIALEVDVIERFQTVQQFSSYSRLIRPEHRSAGKRCGFGNSKIGNPNLKHAFTEAAVFAARHSESIGALLAKLQDKYGKMKSRVILAHKLARAVFHMLKRGEVFDEKRFLGRGKQ